LIGGTTPPPRPAASRSGTTQRQGRWRIAIVEDHTLQRLRTEELLQRQPGLVVVHSCETLPDHVEWLAQQDAADRPHLLVLDLAVERGPSVDPATVESIVRGGTQVLVLSAMAHPPLVRQVLRAGAAGIVGKRDPEEDIVAAVWSVLGRRRWITPELAAIIAGDDDRPRLSDQEERALILYASGLTLDAVARSLGVKPETAKTYLERVKAKYTSAGRAVRTKADLARVAVADGYLGPDVERPDA